MVLFANFIAFAEEHGHRVINFTFHSYAESFPTLRRDIYCSYPPRARRSWMDIVPGVAQVIRKTRIFYHFTRYFSLFNEMYSPFGNAVVTIHEDDSVPVVPLESPAVQEPIRAAQLVLVYGWRYRAPELVRRHAEKIRAFFVPPRNTKKPPPNPSPPCAKKPKSSWVFTCGAVITKAGRAATISLTCRATRTGCARQRRCSPAARWRF